MSLKREIPTEGAAATRIGANDTDNTFDSSLVSSDADGSVLERLEHIKEAADILSALTGGLNAANRVAGKMQVFSVSVTAAANAESDTYLASAYVSNILVESVVIMANDGQTEDLTSCPVFGDQNKRVTLIPDTIAIEANLNDAEKQVAWGSGNGSALMTPEQSIVMEHNGGGAGALDLTVVISYRSVSNGGYLGSPL